VVDFGETASRGPSALADILVVLDGLENVSKLISKYKKKHLKMLGPFATASSRTPPVLILHCHSPGVATVDTTTKMSRSQL